MRGKNRERGRGGGADELTESALNHGQGAANPTVMSPHVRMPCRAAVVAYGHESSFDIGPYPFPIHQPCR
jgi:hypothetical protein